MIIVSQIFAAATNGVTQNIYEWRGKSTETKPTSADVAEGSTYYCIDNGALYMFDGAQWVEQ